MQRVQALEVRPPVLARVRVLVEVWGAMASMAQAASVAPQTPPVRLCFPPCTRTRCASLWRCVSAFWGLF